MQTMRREHASFELLAKLLVSQFKNPYNSPLYDPLYNPPLGSLDYSSFDHTFHLSVQVVVDIWSSMIGGSIAT